MAIDLKLIDKLLANYKKPEDIIGENGLLKQLTKALLERAMQAEMTGHLGYEKHDVAGLSELHRYFKHTAGRVQHWLETRKAIGACVPRRSPASLVRVLLFFTSDE